MELDQSTPVVWLVDLVFEISFDSKFPCHGEILKNVNQY